MNAPEIDKAPPVNVYEIDPLRDVRWPAFVKSHPRSSIFHTREWLEALRRTYNYTPKVLTTSSPAAELTGGIVFCRIDSWLTGSRLVSLPFSDHCEPLVQDSCDFRVLLIRAGSAGGGKLRYAEIRPRLAELPTESGLQRHSQCYLHVLDLTPDLQDLYEQLHKDGMQRKIRRSEREGMIVDQGRSESLLQDFYKLMLLTRRRHRVPPQPFAWFRNLVECLGNRVLIRVARMDGQPVAGLFTLRHKQTLVYKYGCSDERFHKLGGMSRLFWETIQEAKAEGLQEFDLGRSDQGNEGLIRFKDHLGAKKTRLSYWRLSRESPRGLGGILTAPIAQRFFSRLPDNLFRLAGEILYRHAG